MHTLPSAQPHIVHEASMQSASGVFGMQEETLEMLYLTRARKWNYILVKTPSGDIKLFIKGLDSIIRERIGQNREQRKHYGVAHQHLDEFVKSV